MTSETTRVSQRAGLESSLLQPERIADILWRLGNEFIIRFALWLIRLMALSTFRIGVFVVWKKDTEL